MEKSIKMNVFNSQDVVVFNDYKFYEDDEVFEVDDKDLVPNEFIVKNSPFDIDRFFMAQSLFIKDDLENWLKYEGVTKNQLNERILLKDRTAGIHDKKYNAMIARYNKNKSDNDFKSYKLKDVDGLYTELAKVELFNLDQILNFSRVFGLPTGLLETGKSLLLEEPPITLESINYMELNSKLNEYRSKFDSFKDLITGNVEQIKQKNITVQDNLIKRYPDWASLLEGDYTYYAEASDEDILEREKINFIKLINITDFFSGKLNYQNNTFIMENYFRNLFDFGYFQMSQALLNDSELKKCKNCNHFFEVTSDNTEFCPPLPFSDESQCKIEFEEK